MWSEEKNMRDQEMGKGGETEVARRIKCKIGRRQETRTRISSVPNSSTQLDFRR